MRQVTCSQRLAHLVYVWITGRPHKLSLAMLTTLACVGCGGSGTDYPTARVTGSVSIDGEMVESGHVNFMPAPGSEAHPVSAEIESGKYLAENVPLGPSVVTFSISRPTGRIISEPDRTPYPEILNAVPPQYANGMEIQISKDSPTQDFLLTTDEQSR
jgi:hypothetical protein